MLLVCSAGMTLIAVFSRYSSLPDVYAGAKQGVVKGKYVKRVKKMARLGDCGTFYCVSI